MNFNESQQSTDAAAITSSTEDMISSISQEESNEHVSTIAGTPYSDIRQESTATGTTNTDIEKNIPSTQNYKTMNWFHCAFIMAAETVSMGVLSLSWGLSQLGLATGLILILVFGIIAIYSGMVIGNFVRYNSTLGVEVSDFAVCGRVLFGPKYGRLGQELFGIIMVCVLVFIMAAHVVGFQIMSVHLSSKVICAIIWSAVGALVQFVFNIPRTMKHASLLSVLSSVSVIASVIIVMADTHKTRPTKLPAPFEVSPTSSLGSRITAIMGIVLSYSGHVAYFSFQNELKNPKDFNKALYAQLGFACVLYSVVAAVLYCFIGNRIAGIALSSASPQGAKIAYGVASLTIILAGVVNSHVAVKYIYKRYFPLAAATKTVKSYLCWNMISLILWALAFFLSIAIPSFQHMLSFVASLFQAFISNGLAGWLWLWMNKGFYFRNKKQILLTVAHIGLIVIGVSLSAVGVYGTILELRKGNAGKCFSCRSPNKGP